MVARLQRYVYHPKYFYAALWAKIVEKIKKSPYVAPMDLFYFISFHFPFTKHQKTLQFESYAFECNVGFC